MHNNRLPPQILRDMAINNNQGRHRSNHNRRNHYISMEFRLR